MVQQLEAQRRATHFRRMQQQWPSTHLALQPLHLRSSSEMLDTRLWQYCTSSLNR